MKNKKGFSLIELMAVLGIVAILTVMSITGFKFFSEKSTADVLSAQLIHAIHLTQSEAILRQDKVYLCGSSDQTTCLNDWKMGYIIRTTNRVIYHFQTIAGKGILHWRSFPLNKQTLEFLATGFPNAENGTFWFCRKETEKPMWAVVLNQAGRLRIVYPDRNGNILDDKGMELIC